MNYKDYRKEKLVFLKGTDGWSIAEKADFLASCPEGTALAPIIQELEEVSDAIDDGAIKLSGYNRVNVSSMKAYIARRSLAHIQYGRVVNYGDSKDFYVTAYGEKYRINRTWEIEAFISKFTDTSDEMIEHNFAMLARNYYKAEKFFSDRIQNESYQALNADRIAANKMLYAALNACRIEVPAYLEKDSCGYITAQNSRLYPSCDYSYSHNSHGEILVNNAPLSEEQAIALKDTIMEMSGKITAIIDEYKETIGATLGKRRA